MLPAAPAHEFRLADVMPSCLAALRGEPNPLGLPAVDRAVVVVVDGLGIHNLRAAAGHARTLAAALSKRSAAASGFPTTTAANLATLMTGTHPGEHGLVGYTVLDPAQGRVVNQLSGWQGIEPESWQRMPTVFERARGAGIGSFVFGLERFRHSPLTRAILRGAGYHAGTSIAERVQLARGVLAGQERALGYLYLPELDKAAHAHGWESARWSAALEEADAGIRELIEGLGPRDGVLVTADHGVIDVPETGRLLLERGSELLEGVLHTAGEPRCLQLHLDPALGEDGRDRVLERWRTAESKRAWVVTREEAIEAGWFGPSVADAVVGRIGDILVAARSRVVYYDERTATPQALRMVGQHGSWSAEEFSVPLLRFGAFAA